MRSWIMHPLVFYPFTVLLAVLVIGFSLRPQAWPRPPAPVSGQQAGPALILGAAAFDAPAPDPRQNLTVVRDFWGKSRTLRIAVLPRQGTVGPDDDGVRLLLTPEAVRSVAGRVVRIDVAYNPLPVNGASALAVSLQGGGPRVWTITQTPPQQGVAQFTMNAPADLGAIGLRTISTDNSEAFGLEITRITLTPLPNGATAN